MALSFNLNRVFKSNRAFKLGRATQSRGFTLVEVLVALGIFAVLATGYLIVAANTARGIGRLQEKVFALWIAEDAVTRLRTFESDKVKALKTERVEYLGQEWQITFKTQKTDVKSLNRITLYVALRSDPDNSIASLETYFAEDTFIPDQT